MTAAEIIETLGLIPHPKEGGFFRELYRSDESIDLSGTRYRGKRAFSTAIYFLLTPETFSAMHLLQSDEIFHLYLGGPVEMLNLYPDGSGKAVRIGFDLMSDERPQVVVPRGVWQGSRLANSAEYALMGTTVAPGFEYEDFSDGVRAELTAKYPRFAGMIDGLCLK